MGILKIKDTRTEEERELCEKLSAKMAEYKAKFDDDFCTEFLPMTKAEIIEDIDKCIKHNKKWEGYIVPEIDENDLI